MSYRRAYDIAFVGLKPGIHVFEYEINNKFFEPYHQQEFNNCVASVKLSLDKKNGFMLLKFDIDGSLEVTCDRCGNQLTKSLWDEFNILVKMVEEPDMMNAQEEDPDVFYISRTESHINVEGWIYEFLSLSVPFQKMCSEEEMGGPQCNLEVLEKLKQMEDEAQKDRNPLWKGLDKFKDLE